MLKRFKGNKMKVDTVNVIEWDHGTLQQIVSFTDNENGNKQAEELFASFVKEHGCPEDEVEDCTENGIFEIDGYKTLLAHS